jgi:hypothetical protein
MDKEARTVFLVSLTLLLLAFSNWIGSGKFIFTFPVNDFILQGVSIYFLILDRKNKLNYLFVLFASLNFFSNSYNLEFFFDSKQMEWYANSIFPDICLLLVSLFYLVFYFFRKTNNLLFYFFLSLSLTCIVLSQFENLFILYYLSFVFLPILLFVSKKNESSTYKSTYYFFFLFTILNLTKVLTLYFL